MAAVAIVITGTPGTGKTTVTDLIKENGYFTISLGDFAEKYDCFEEYDEERDTHVINEDKLVSVLTKYLNAGHGIVIIEGHYGDLVPKNFVTKCFVLSTPPNILAKRLSERGYSKEKISENLESEIMQICWSDAIDAFGPSKVTRIMDMPWEKIGKLIQTYAYLVEENQRFQLNDLPKKALT